MKKMLHITNLISRLAIGLVFLALGTNNLIYYSRMNTLFELMSGLPSPQIFFIITTIILITGGIFLSIGFKVKYACVALIILIICVMIVVPASMKNPNDVFHLFKNIVIIAALLHVYANDNQNSIRLLKKR